MTEAELSEVMERVWAKLPPSGALTEADQAKFWRAIEELLPYLPYDSRTPVSAADNTGQDQ